VDILILVLRVIHIFSGVFWVGFSFFNIGFLQPTVRATGAEGQKTMQYLTQKTRLLTTVYATATLSLLSGLMLYWLGSGSDLALSIGGMSGVIAWTIAVVVIRGIFNQMRSVGQAIQAGGGKPNPEQTKQMQALVARLSQVGQVALVFLAIALLGMSIADYF